MKNISLYIPELDDYWYEEKIESQKETMSYNAGYDVSYYGYHYDTGCIDFPSSRWMEVFNKRIQENRFFAYIKDNDTNEFIGYVNYQLNDGRYECGILLEHKYRGLGYSKIALELLIKEARKNGIKELYDNFEIDRGNTLSLFESVGFKIYKKEKWLKFNKYVDGVIVKIDLNNKNELREKYKNIRKNILNKEEKSKEITNNIINTEEYKKSKIIGIYYSLDSEVNTKYLIDKSLNDKKIVCLPKVIDNDLVFYRYEKNNKLLKSSFGVLEPVNNEIISKNDINLMIVPGICFDKNNNRIGFGKGYYDRYLGGTNIYKIGICFEEQLLKDDYILCEENDIKMDKIVY